jgi:hypothetical protein
VLTIVLTALVDRLAVQRRRRGTSDRRSDGAIDAAEAVGLVPDNDLKAPVKGSGARAGAMRFQHGSWLDAEAANSQDTVVANSQDTVAAKGRTGGSPSVDIPQLPQPDVEDTATEGPWPGKADGLPTPRHEESFNT